MSNKTLLNESQIRQFMKLAKLEPLTQGFVEGLTTELRTGKTGALGPKSGRANPGHGRGQGEADDGSMFQEAEAGPEELEKFAADDLADDSLEGDEEAAHDEEEIGAELGADDAGEDAGRMVAVDDFLAALESALEDVMGDEVEIDSDEMAPEEEEEVEVDAELSPGGGEEIEVGAEEEELMETGAKRTGASKDDKGKDKEDPEDRDYTGHGMRKGDESETDPGDEDDTWRKGKKSKTHSGVNKEGVESTDELVEQITKRVAARILKTALAKNN